MSKKANLATALAGIFIAMSGASIARAECMTFGCAVAQAQADALYAPRFQKNFSDVEGEFEFDIKSLASNVIVNTSCRFQPEAFATRAEALKIVMTAMDFMRPGWRPYSDMVPFSDVSQTDWFFDDVSDALVMNLIAPSNYFRPNEAITRQEFSKLVYRGLTLTNTMPNVSVEPVIFSDSGMIDSDIAPMIDALTRSAVISGFKPISGDGLGTFRPTENISRAHLSKIVSRAFFPNIYASRLISTLPDRPILSPVKDIETADRVRAIVADGYGIALDANGFNADKLTIEGKLALANDIKSMGMSLGFDEFGADEGQIGWGLRKQTSQVFAIQSLEMNSILSELDAADDMKPYDYRLLLTKGSLGAISVGSDLLGYGVVSKLASIPRVITILRAGTYIKALNGTKKMRSFLKIMDSPAMRVFFAVVESGFIVTKDIAYSDDYSLAHAAGALSPFLPLLSEGAASVALSTSQKTKLVSMLIGKVSGAMGALAGSLISIALADEDPSAREAAEEIILTAGEFVPIAGGFVATFHAARTIQSDISTRGKPFFARMLATADDHWVEQRRLFERTLSRRLQVILQSANVYLNTCDR